MNRFLLALIFISSVFYSNSQKKMTKEEYVIKYHKVAINEMNKYKIPASITLAQGILESDAGNSDLATKAFNHFGIKCKSNWTGKTFIKDDDTKDECFRAYNDEKESFRDHSLFLSERDRYSKLFEYDTKDYKSWAYGLKAAGYATNPKYPQLLIKYIEDLMLYKYDNYGLSDIIEDELPIIKVVDSIKGANADSSSNNKPKKLSRFKKANSLKFVIVDDSFTVEKIAIDNGISMDKLLMYNDCIYEQNISIGQNFFLEPKLKSSSIDIHEVKEGESVYDISQIYGIRQDYLRKYNKLGDWQQPKVGEAFFLRYPRTTPIRYRTYYEVQKEKKNLKLNTTNEDSEKKEIKRYKMSHKVQKGETIFSIAKKYEVPPFEIDRWNTLNDAPLKIGQELIIFVDY